MMARRAVVLALLALAVAVSASTKALRLGIWLPKQPTSRLPTNIAKNVVQDAVTAAIVQIFAVAPSSTSVAVSREGHGTLLGITTTVENADAVLSMMRSRRSAFARDIGSRLGGRGFDVTGVTVTEPTPDEPAILRKEHMYIMAIAGAIAFLALANKKRTSMRQLSKLRDRQRRRRTEMVNGVDGSELNWSYQEDSEDESSEDDEEAGLMHKQRETARGSARRRSSA
eukprot:g5562.t1